MRSYSIGINHMKQSRSGFALVTALIFLVILLLLGTAVVSTTSSEEKMTQNARDSDIAFAAAEAAMRDAELNVNGSYQWPYAPLDISTFDVNCTGGLCDATDPSFNTYPVNLDFYSSTGTGSNSIVIGTTTLSPSVVAVTTANQPKYMVELVCAEVLGDSLSGGFCPNKAFRITATGKGRLANTTVTLQEVYRRLH